MLRRKPHFFKIYTLTVFNLLFSCSVDLFYYRDFVTSMPVRLDVCLALNLRLLITDY